MSEILDEQVALSEAKYMAGVYRSGSTLMVKGEGSYLWDINGKKYVDFLSGIAVNSLGHNDPEISKIIVEQCSTLLHASNSCPSPWSFKLAALLVEKTKEFGGMYNASNVYFGNSGTEANEAALKFARKWGKSISPDKTEFICFNSSFHGRTFGSLSVTSNTKYQEPFTPLVPGVKQATVGDIESVEKVISDKTCGVIIEPLQGEGGIHEVDINFLVSLKELCKKHKAVLIYDEVQCGMGRSGSLWVHSKLPKEGHPDIFTSAKALGNGCPIGATIISQEVNETLIPGDHGATFGGNPLSTRVATHVIQRIADQEFLNNVQKKSELLRSELSKLQQKYPTLIKEVRGQGLMLGMELTFESKEFLVKSRSLGLCTAGVAGNVVRLLPALNIPNEVMLEGVKLLEQTIQEFDTK